MNFCFLAFPLAFCACLPVMIIFQLIQGTKLIINGDVLSKNTNYSYFFISKIEFDNLIIELINSFSDYSPLLKYRSLNLYLIFSIETSTRMLTENLQNQTQAQIPFVSRQVYKNETRKIKTRLFLLVLYHVIVIFIFVGLACVQYLLHQQTELAIMSDTLFFVYSLMVLLIFKYKNRKLLYTSMFLLLLIIGTRVAITLIQVLIEKKVEVISVAMMILSVANCIVPWTLIILWDKLNDSKWRKTFDFFQKIYNRPMTMK